jgi:hypothetical protein
MAVSRIQDWTQQHTVANDRVDSDFSGSRHSTIAVQSNLCELDHGGLLTVGRLCALVCLQVVRFFPTVTRTLTKWPQSD